MNESNDILQNLFKKHPFNPNILTRLVCGSKYCGLELENGNIGVCSTLGIEFTEDKHILEYPDFKRLDHRIMINAWVNACANYTIQPNGEGDIFDAVDFSRYRDIVMVGFFGSLSDKLRSNGNDLTIFDLDPTDKPVSPIETQRHHLSKTDAVILTATSIFNFTFNDLIENSNPNADIFILGPSTPLDALLFNYQKVKALFGTWFSPFDKRVLDIISKGGGTKSFLPFGKKVYFYK